MLHAEEVALSSPLAGCAPPAPESFHSSKCAELLSLAAVLATFALLHDDFQSSWKALGMWAPSTMTRQAAGRAIPMFAPSVQTQGRGAVALPTSTPHNDDVRARLPTAAMWSPADYGFKQQDDASAVKRQLLSWMTLANLGGGLGLLLRGRRKSVGSLPTTTALASSQPSAEEAPVENEALLNLLWFGLVAMLVALLAGVAWEAYLGPLRAFILHDIVVSAFAVVSGVLWVRVFKTLASEGIIGRTLSRKLIHITSAPLFLLCWPFYSQTPTARCIAALPPLANSIRLLSAGLGKADNQDAVQAISRQGGRKELLQGPLYYVLVLLMVTVAGWRTSLASYVSICLMAGGDGVADIVGRRYGTVKLPWNQAKSWAGSLAMFLGGFLLSTGFVTLFGVAGYLPPILENHFLPRLGLVCLLTTIVESLPNTWWWPLDDNVSVPLVAVILSAVILHAV